MATRNEIAHSIVADFLRINAAKAKHPEHNFRPHMEAIRRNMTAGNRHADVECLDYDDDLPAMLATLPQGWTNSTWHNDACPSFMHPDGATQVFADYRNPELSEFSEYRKSGEFKRFQIISCETGETYKLADSWSDILAMIASPDFEAWRISQ